MSDETADTIRERLRMKRQNPEPSAMQKAVDEREKLYEEEGRRRAKETARKEAKEAAEKVKTFNSTFAIDGDAFRTFNDLALNMRLNGFKLTYQKVFMLGLETFGKMNDTERIEYMQRIKKEGKAK